MINDFYQEIEKLRVKFKKNYKKGEIKIDQGIDQSKALTDFKNIEFDREWLAAYFEKVVLTLEKFAGENQGSGERLREGLEKKYLDLVTLVKKVFSSDLNYLNALGQKLGLDKEDLFFLGLQLGKPVFELYADELKGKINLSNWGKGYCPVCGSPPAFAYLRKEDGKRILWCQFCETEWSFMRLKCPFCSNEDQNSLRYFFTEEESFYRVDVCDRCKKYLKTIDQRKMPDPDKLLLYRESIQTLSLDLLAKKDGYLNAFV